MCKFFKKLFKFITILGAIAGACAAAYYAFKKFMDKKEASCEDFVPCEVCDTEAEETADAAIAAEEPAAEEASEEAAE